MGRLVWQILTIVCLLGTEPCLSIAQTTDSQAIAAAQGLVDEAGDLMDAKKFADACPKLEQARKLVPEGIGVHLALAECYEGVGRLASAQGEYLQAEALAKKANDSRRARDAEKAAAKLKPKLATITLAVPNEVRNLEGVSLTWDRYVWEPALWGTAIPVDIGRHSLQVQAPGWKTWKAEVTVEADGIAANQDVPMLEKLPEEKPKQSPAIQVKPPAPASMWLRPVGIAATSIGVAGLITGSTLGALAIARFNGSNAEGKCDAKNLCNALGVSLRGESLGFARWSSVLVPVGVAFTGGGLALLIASMSAKKKDARETTGIMQWQIDASPGWVGLRGVW